MLITRENMSKTIGSIFRFLFVIFQFQFSRVAPNTFINKHEKSDAHRHTHTHELTPRLYSHATHFAVCRLFWIFACLSFPITSFPYVHSLKSFCSTEIARIRARKERTQNRKPYKNRDEKKITKQKLQNRVDWGLSSKRTSTFFSLLSLTHSLIHTHTLMREAICHFFSIASKFFFASDVGGAFQPKIETNRSGMMYYNWKVMWVMFVLCTFLQNHGLE